MTERIIDMPDDCLYEWQDAYYPDERDDPMAVREEIVRCRDCVHYYEAEEYHPQGNYDKRCCKYFDTYDDEVEPDGYCAWSCRRSDKE